MVTALLNFENISVFTFLCSREKFSAQLKRTSFRNNCKMPRKKIATCDFDREKRNFRQSQLCLKFRIHCSLFVNPDWPTFSIWGRKCSSSRPCCVSQENTCNLRNNVRQRVCLPVFCRCKLFPDCRNPRTGKLHKLPSFWNRRKYWLMFSTWFFPFVCMVI